MTGPADLIVEEPRWLQALPDLQAAADTAMAVALRDANLDPAECEIALLACDDTRIAALNATFRGRRRATNVLSWPTFPLAPGQPDAGSAFRPEARFGEPVALGDVAIAFQTSAREAEQRGVGLKSHVIHLILHGTLHLLGYDHRTDADAEVMEGKERRLLAGLGISDPYVLVEADAGPSASDR